MDKAFSERARLADKLEGPEEPVLELTPKTKTRRHIKDYWAAIYYFFVAVGAAEIGRHLPNPISTWYVWLILLGGFGLLVWLPEFINSRITDSGDS